MPCPSQGVPSRTRVDECDLLFLHCSTANVRYEPQNKAELVAAVISSAEGGRSLRAIGANWSPSEAAIAEDIVVTGTLDDSAAGLQRHLSQPFAVGSSPLDQRRLRNGGGDFLAAVCSGDPRASGRHFIHVEAGIRLRHLLADLKACGLALPTMGDGAGQSLAGALSTGTHGADFQVLPLVDWVHAVHLVGAGGQESWITQEGSIFADERVLRIQDWCEDARIVAHDDAFDAVRIGVGRMGIVYSMVLEVVPEYSLIEVNLEHRWSEIRRQLATVGTDGRNPGGLLNATLSDFDGGWVRTQVLDRSEKYYPYGFRYVGGPAYQPPEVIRDQDDMLKVRRHAEPPYSAWDQQHYQELFSFLGFAELAADLRGGPPMPLHHINIAVNLARPDQCWARRRWSRPGGVRFVFLGPEERDPVEKAIVDNPRNPAVAAAAFRNDQLPSRLELVFGVIIHELTPVQAARLDQFMAVDMSRIVGESGTSGEAIFMIIYKLATDPILAPKLRPRIIAAVSKIIGSRFGRVVRAGPASGGLHANILDAHDYTIDGAQSGNSAEFFFNAASAEYRTFVDTVIRLAIEHAPVFGYMGLRFTPGASPLLAMQRFPLTASVEVSTARARQEDVYAEFWSNVHAAANELNGIPHWGQEFRHSATDLALLYGDDMATWRRMLAELSIDGPDIFSTRFSRNAGLEPSEAAGIFDANAIEQFLTALRSAVC